MAIKFNPKEFGRIGVLMGGPSTERVISLKSGKAVYLALEQLGLEVISIDIKSDDSKENIKILKSANIDSAFIALHGYNGEDGRIQELLEYLNIPYTGSDKYACNLAMDKVKSKQI
ncbi:MAG: D-alanine--D-alanine ligase, partial [Candidatus Omnitrophica bacterium]|nr:D-alanine--D-alanine ligase [Candidatus Omnitrophota bacterium]